MQAMQYELPLPADYDMDIIRSRASRVGPLFDDWDGLGLKAVLMRERGVDGSPVNEYAPFYLWDTLEGMKSFLWGGAFQRLADDFGRPEVQQWTGVAYEKGVAAASPARLAVRHRQPVAAGVQVSEVMEEAAREAERLAALDGAVCAAAVVDSRRWELVHFSLWDHGSPKAPGDVFQVLHLSAPGLDRLPRGRQW
jgi:hypothetical protein